jgi:hypothetical protein
MPLPFLPNEIWFSIADFIELDDDHLRGIIGMNRPLFELAMGKLYREVSLTDPDPTSGLAPLCASGPSEANYLSGGNWPERGSS